MNKLFLLFLFLINGNIYCQEIKIQEYFSDNTSSLYYLGIKYFYRGLLFSDVFINGNIEDKYSELRFIIPVDKKTGICIQRDKRNILDTFLFMYDPELGRFIHCDDKFNMSILGHRLNVLKEIINIRFRIMRHEQIKLLLMQNNILIE